MYEARLYLDVGLQAYYFLISIFAIWYWMRGGERKSEPAITRTSWQEWVGLGLVTAVGIGILATAISQLDLAWMPQTDVPLWDATVTVGSLAATWLLVRKRIENWLVWIVVDSAYVPLCLYKELYFFAGLYTFYIVACVYGWVIWRKHMKLQVA
jgi:nicotinamide mononucleotide transporter